MDEEASSDMSDPSLVPEEEPSSRRMMATATKDDEEEDDKVGETEDNDTKHNSTIISAEIPLNDQQEESSSTNKQTTTTTTQPQAMTTSTAMISRILRWYVRFSASAGNQDKLLNVIAYSLRVLGKNKPWPQKLALEISFARYVTRLIGWPTALEAAWHDSWQGGTSPVHQWLGRVMAYSMLLYYPMENMAYALWMKPPGTNVTTPRSTTTTTSIWWWKAETWSYLSNRCWLVYVVAEMAQSLLKLQDETSNNSKNVAMINSRLQLARNALFVLPCLQWARSDWDTTTRPWLKVETINLLLWAESIISIYQAWRNSQEK